MILMKLIKFFVMVAAVVAVDYNNHNHNQNNGKSVESPEVFRLSDGLSIQHKKTGVVVAPTSYGFAKFHVDCNPLKEQYKALKGYLRKTAKSLLAAQTEATRNSMTYFKAFEKQVKIKLDEIAIQLDKPPCSKPTKSTDTDSLKVEGNQELKFNGTHLRTKRSPAAAVAAAVPGVISLGLAIDNKIQLVEIFATQGALIQSVKILAQVANNNTVLIEGAIKTIDGNLESMEWAMAFNQFESIIWRTVHELDIELDNLQLGYVAALRGDLSHYFVPPKALNESLTEVSNRAARLGLEVVEFPIKLQTAYSQPITAYEDENGFHVMVSVPLKPVHAPVFDLIEIKVLPAKAPDHEIFASFGSEKINIVVEPRRRIHKEMSALELLKCRTVSNIHLCQESTFDTVPTTCGAALFFKDHDAVRTICEKYFSRPGLTTNVNQAGELSVWTPERTVVTKHCANKAAQLVTINGYSNLPIGSGCYLETDKTITYFNQNVVLEEKNIEEKADLDLITDDVDLDLVDKKLDEFKLSRVQIPLEALEHKGDAERGFNTHILAWATCIALGLLFLCMLSRFCWHLKRDCQKQVEQVTNMLNGGQDEPEQLEMW